MRVLLVAASCGAVFGFNVMNPANGKCLDLHAPCEDGTETPGCKRKHGKELEKGTNLQTWDCHGEPNQEFELAGHGRLKNPATGLCIDILAPCQDGSDDPHCARMAVKDLKEEQNIQMWTCHDEDEHVSNSLGNQMWTMTEKGELKNTGSGLCLVTIDDPDNGTATNVEVNTCGDFPNHQHFVFVPPDYASEATKWAKGLASGGSAKFEILGGGASFKREGRASSSLSATLVGSLALAFVGGFMWFRKSPVTEQGALE